jgi:hypothetical protein
VESRHTSVTRFFREQRVLLASLLLFGLFLVEFALLHRFKLYDLMVYDWMQEYRSCALDRARVISEILDNQAVPDCGAGIVCGRLARVPPSLART